jgi:N-acetylneuraminic acid mutarotase
MKKICLLVLSLIALFICTAKAQFKGYSWKVLTTNGTLLPREENDFVNIKGRFYLIGGRKVQDISVFDPKTSTWSNAAKPPIELHHFQAIVYKDEIYIAGAMTAGYPHEKPLANIYIYNPKADSWRIGAAIPAERQRGACGAVVYKNKFYLVCGILDGHWTGNVNWFDEYDPQTNQWKKLPDAPVARDHFKAAIVDGKLYCIGGAQTDAMEKKVLDKTISEIDVYDFNTGTWSVANAKLPTPRAGCSVVVKGNDILIIAGESTAQKVAHNEVEVYNVKTGEFTKLRSLVEGTHATGAIYFDKKIYIAAGVGNSGGSPLLTSIQCFSDQ